MLDALTHIFNLTSSGHLLDLQPTGACKMRTATGHVDGIIREQKQTLLIALADGRRLTVEPDGMGGSKITNKEPK